MPVNITLPDIPSEAALSRVREWLQQQLHSKRSRGNAERLQFSLHAVVDELLKQEQDKHRRENPNGMIAYQRDAFPNSASFQDAAWELCSRGIIRPAPTRQGQDVPRWSGFEYSVTAYGEEWLSERDGSDLIPSEAGRFSGALASFDDMFGGAYRARSQEALRCYQAHAYLATCAMCGAAAEAILLTTAIRKTEDEEAVYKAYRGSKGRSRVENMLVQNTNRHVQDQLDQFMSLLKYWRDDAAHGAESRLSEQEAFLSLLMLLRFAAFVHERWDDLTAG